MNILPTSLLDLGIDVIMAGGTLSILMTERKRLWTSIGAIGCTLEVVAASQVNNVPIMKEGLFFLAVNLYGIWMTTRAPKSETGPALAR
jgi:hypothetical protein